jgi:hypothetical protein
MVRPGPTRATCLLGFLSTLILSPLACAAGSDLASSPSPSLAPPPIFVLGFVGGFVRHDEPRHPEVTFIQHLRSEYPSQVEAQVFENRRYRDAYKMICQRLDTNHDGRLSDLEKQTARIMLFGHSWGASAVVSLARRLEHVGIPVLLTVQVDSVAKVGQNDSLIPSNVQQAVNFYQTRGWVHGQPKITAADPSRTRILGNYQLSYDGEPVACSGSPWFGRVFTHSHIAIECDPRVWSQIGLLIRTQLPANTSQAMHPEPSLPQSEHNSEPLRP